VGAATGGERERHASWDAPRPFEQSDSTMANVHRARTEAAPWMPDHPRMIAHPLNLNCKNFFYPRNTQTSKVA